MTTPPAACNCSEVNTTTALRDDCYEATSGDYDQPLHIAAVFIVLIVSWAGATLPVFVARFPSLVRLNKVMWFGRFFGGGVILATAFIHIFPDAVSALSDPCLPSWFSEKYTPSAGLFAMLAAMGMHLIEWLAMQYTPGGSHDHKKETDSAYTPEIDEDDSAPKSEGQPNIRECNTKHGADDDDCHSHALLLERQKHKITTYTLEFGISVHSVIIGIALGTARSEFIALFIAILFHQFFEGIGLGYMLSEVTFAEGYQFLVWLNALLYGLTTPLGIGIGIILHNTTYSDTNSLIVTGILDAISSGILLYTALVTLVSKAFQTPKFLAQNKYEKIACFICFYVGSGIMATLAIWA